MLKSEWPKYSEKMIQEVVKVLESGKVNQWTGNKVNTFEKEFCDYFNIKYAVFNNIIFQ